MTLVSSTFLSTIGNRCSTYYSTDILKAKPYRGPGLQGGPPNKYFKPILLLITVSDCVDTITHLKLRQSGRSLNFVYQRLSYNKAITNICRYTISGYWLPPTSTVIYNAVNKTCQLQLALPY